MSPSLVQEQLLLDAAPGMVIAVDEVGRGALAGPVSIGAVALVSPVYDPPVGIDDSKRLSAKRRAALVDPIRTWVAASVVVHVEAVEIDERGISKCLGMGAAEAIAQLRVQLDVPIAGVLLDGKHDFVTPATPGLHVHTVIGGDRQCASIAAASILAKEERDALMKERHLAHPHFGWDRNVGYGTAEHRRAISEHGSCGQHRRSWALPQA